MKIIFIMMSFFLVLMIPSSTIIQKEPSYHLVLENPIEGLLEDGNFDPRFTTSSSLIHLAMKKSSL